MSSPPKQAPVPVEGQPLSLFDEALMDAFAKDVGAQANRMDDLAKQLVVLNLAIPGLFAAALKLMSGDAGKLGNLWVLVFAFLAWMMSLGIAFVSLLPEKYLVDPNDLDAIQKYFTQATRRKFGQLVAAVMLSFFGICFGVFSVFANR